MVSHQISLGPQNSLADEENPKSGRRLAFRAQRTVLLILDYLIVDHRVRV